MANDCGCDGKIQRWFKRLSATHRHSLASFTDSQALLVYTCLVREFLDLVIPCKTMLCRLGRSYLEERCKGVVGPMAGAMCDPKKTQLKWNGGFAKLQSPACAELFEQSYVDWAVKVGRGSGHSAPLHKLASWATAYGG